MQFDDCGVAAVDEGVGADIPGCAVADAIGSGELRIRVRPQAVGVVAEAQARGAVGLDLDDEMRVRRAVGEQVLLQRSRSWCRSQARLSA